MALIDESTIAALSGELDPRTTGRIYCTRSASAVILPIGDGQPSGPMRRSGGATARVSAFGICRVHRAEIMDFRGSWADAEREAKRACEELGTNNLMLGGDAQYEIGEVRLRVGDLEGAGEAFRQAHKLNREPQPGMSLLRLAHGDPSRQHFHQAGTRQCRITAFAQARLLPAAIEIGLAAGDLDSVTHHVIELEQIAGSFRTAALTAAAEYGRGRLLLAKWCSNCVGKIASRSRTLA